jgi:chemotaxis family two-component system response regulator Rcp1
MSDAMVKAAARPAELLLVEDNPNDVLLTREALSGAKLVNALSVAGDGEEALSMLRRQGRHAGKARPDLILLDLNLPRMSGREVLKAIRADPELRRIPVIVMTSSATDIETLDRREICADGYIVKPVNFERLTQIVASIEAFHFAVMVSPAVAVTRSAHA